MHRFFLRCIPHTLRFPVDTVPAPPSLAGQVGTMELRVDADATTEVANATTALEGAHATAEPVHVVTAPITRVSGHTCRMQT